MQWSKALEQQGSGTKLINASQKAYKCPSISKQDQVLFWGEEKRSLKNELLASASLQGNKNRVSSRLSFPFPITEHLTQSSLRN